MLPWTIESELLSKTVAAFLWLTSTTSTFLRSKMKCRSHKTDNCYKLSLSKSVMHPFRPSFALALFFREKSLNIYSCYLYFKEVPPSVLPFNLISLCVPSPCCERAPPLIQCTIHASSPLIFLQGNQINKWINKQLPLQYYSCHFLRYHLHKKSGSRGKKRDLYFLQHFSATYFSNF